MMRACLLVIALGFAVIASACGGDAGAKRTSVSPSSAATDSIETGTLTVYAASSLTDAFKEIGDAFDRAHAGVHTEFNFAGSPTLRTQLEQGAEADVLAVADQPNMQAALDKKLVSDGGSIFARNKLTIIVPQGNPGGVTEPKDLAKPGLKLVLAQADVPAGKYARDAIAKMAADGSFGERFNEEVTGNIVSNEPNVKSVVTKVQLGEADAGIVYTTDVTAGVAGDIETITIPDAFNVIASYPMAVLAEAKHGAAARSFIDYVLSDAGQTILRKYGFLSP
jgi:molybdate transport system substrate-binding protein